MNSGGWLLLNSKKSCAGGGFRLWYTKNSRPFVIPLRGPTFRGVMVIMYLPLLSAKMTL